jgi:general secretion pathway protein A
MLHYLMRALVQELGKNRRVVLIIDEAQHMPAHTLEKLRLFSNIETMDEKLLQIVLVGQPELDVKLNAYSMRQLKQRIAVRATIRPLTREESIDYIRHRIARAGSDVNRVLTRWAVRSIVRAAKGYPRSINILCDNTLVSGFGAQQRPVRARIARTIIADLRGRARRGWLGWVPRLAAGLAIGASSLSSGSSIVAEEHHGPRDLRAQNAG